MMMKLILHNNNTRLGNIILINIRNNNKDLKKHI